jgi:hypothetical protein
MSSRQGQAEKGEDAGEGERRDTVFFFIKIMHWECTVLIYI